MTTTQSEHDDLGLIAARGLRKVYRVGRGFRRGEVSAADNSTFTIYPGETYSLVGETGCGKTTTARMVLMTERATSGDLYFRGKNVNDFTSADRRDYRSSVQAVFQDPWSSLNPRLKVEEIIAEPLEASKRVTKAESKKRVAELLAAVGLPASGATRYPHEFSGGQRQRVAIARALSSDPELIVLDEPVSALDVSIRAQIMNLLKDVQAQFDVSFLLIAHQLPMVRHMSHRIAVMYLGQIVEEADSTALFRTPKHPYSKALISADLPNHPDVVREQIVLTGETPSPLAPPTGCRFHTRCPLRKELGEPAKCVEEAPILSGVEPGHSVACHFAS